MTKILVLLCLLLLTGCFKVGPNFKSPETNSSGKQYKSTVVKSIFDCQASRIQIVALYFYSDQMGKGEVVSSSSFPITESEWSYAPPNSIGDSLIKVACGRK